MSESRREGVTDLSTVAGGSFAETREAHIFRKGGDEVIFAEPIVDAFSLVRDSRRDIEKRTKTAVFHGWSNIGRCSARQTTALQISVPRVSRVFQTSLPAKIQAF